MKNLLIYTGPNKKFDDETATLAKIQIDNSLDLGWKKEDIMLVCDFAFEYNGVKAKVIEDGVYYTFDNTANKIAAISYLIKNGFTEDGKLYWCHDFDAYQLNPINESELQLDNFDAGFTHYTYKPQWQLGSLFFKKRSRDIFEMIDKGILKQHHSSRNDEKVLTKLITANKINPKRYRKMNVTYNIMKRCLATIYRQAEKPLKVVHFHPKDKDALMKHSALEMFMYGKNSLGFPLMNDRLIKIFHYHGIK